MPAEYEMVVDPATFVSTGVPILIHLLVVAAESFVAGLFLIQGAALLARPGRSFAFLDRFGALRSEGRSGRFVGAIQVTIGIFMLMPLLLRWPWPASFVATIFAVAALIHFGRDASPTSRPMRRLTLVAALLTLAFMAWERDDPNAQTVRILFKANEWRAHELDWQLKNDVRSPKVGDLAPDFELEDPSGEHSVRLSSFFGTRPVALVFGSYT